MGPISPQTTTALGAELLTVVAKLNRLATQRIGLPLPWAQARLLGTIDDQGEARISDLAELDHCSQPTMTTQVRRLEDAGLTRDALAPLLGDAETVEAVMGGRRPLTVPMIQRLRDTLDIPADILISRAPVAQHVPPHKEGMSMSS